jgi:hypothetical protein
MALAFIRSIPAHLSRLDSHFYFFSSSFHVDLTPTV